MQKQIDYLAKKTLDLSLRNPQLNFRPERSTNIEILGNLQDFYDQIVKDNKGLNIHLNKLNLIKTNREETDLENDLLNLYRKQKLTINEYGFHPLYAVFGLLKWIDPASNKEILSPLLMVPVEITKKGSKQLNLAYNEDEIVLNPTLVHKLSLEGIDLSVHDLLEHQAFDITHYLDIIQGLPNIKDQYEVIQKSYLGLFSSTNLYIYKDLLENKNQIETHKIIQRLYQKDEADYNQENFILPSNLDETLKEKNNYQILNADGSQEAAILASTENMSFVLQGPPGTGKSQTITNMIAQAIASNKKVLFVSEKKAALDVVSEKLKAKGLDLFTLDLHHYQTKKDQLIQQLVNAIEEYKVFDYEESELYNRLDALKEKLNKNYKFLYIKNPNLELSLYELYGKLLELKAYPILNYKFEKIYDLKETELHLMIDQVTRLSKVDLNEKEMPRVFKQLKDSFKMPKELFQEEIIYIQNNLKKSIEIKEKYQLEVEDIKELELTEKLYDYLIQMPQFENHLKVKNYQQALEEIELIETKLKEIKKLGIDYQLFEKDYEKTIHVLSETKGFLGSHSKEYKELFKEVTQYINDAKIKQNDLVELLTSYQEYFEVVEKNKNYHNLKEDKKIFNWLLNLPKKMSKKDLEKQTLLTLSERKDNHKEIKDYLTSTQRSLDFLNTLYEKNNFTKLENKQIKPLNDILTNYELLKPYFVKKKYEDKIKDPLITKLYESIKEYDLASWDKIILKRYYLEWMQYLEFKTPIEDTNELVLEDEKLFSELEERKLEENIHRIKKNVFYHYPKENSSEVKTILAENLKTRGKKTVRQLIDLIPDTLLKMKPCWLMSPVTVSAFLPNTANLFDLVIFDEASQVVPEYAIGSIYRSSQVIICGDHEQLPPTKFFSQVMELEDEEYEEISDYESILDIARTSLSSYQLNWHYRSKYSELIEYSNKKIYQSLIAVSEPSFQAEGIKYHHLEQGYYDNQINRKEAEYIAKKVIEHARKTPNLSLGVIAFSRKQEKEIDYQIRKLLKHESGLDKFFDDEKEEYFFVKNLENVQGDERDVIYLSICYGKNKEGKLSYRFGPINQAVGYRRLNVAITRAREEMNIVSSILPSDLSDPNKNPGIAFLKGYLEFAYELKKNKITYQDPQDSLTKDIYVSLKEHQYKVYYNEKLFNSLSIEDENKAICIYIDNHGYAKLPTLKDRNILAPSLIKQKNWAIIKIDGIAWYQNKENELKSLLEQIENYQIKKYVKVPEEKIIIEKPKEIEPEIIQVEEKPEILDTIEEEVLEKPSKRDLLEGQMIRITVENLPRTDDETIVQYVKRFILEVIDKEEGITELDLMKRLAPLYETKKLSIHEVKRIQQWLEIWNEKKEITYSQGVITE
ncbi:DUF4011 domain-containing protein [Acholeplasma palmae]|nr:DUF4011 domain-containing protein [Alteracholeplasma palmae]